MFSTADNEDLLCTELLFTNYNRDGSFTVDSDSSEDSSFTRSGFMKRSTSFENKSYGFSDKKQDCKESKSDMLILFFIIAKEMKSFCSDIPLFTNVFNSRQ
jgi:hypothetical protein